MMHHLRKATSALLLLTCLSLSAFQTDPAVSALDAVRPAVDDRAFLRRVYLDLAGRIPTPAETRSFLADNAVDKRNKTIDQLLRSQAFADRMTAFFGDLLYITGYAVGANHRNHFHLWIREQMQANRPIDAFVRDILTNEGPPQSGRSAFSFYIREVLEVEVRQDVMDETMGRITEAFLGIRTNCISCHNGVNHLEQVNVELTGMTRQQFWGMAAFLSQSYAFLPADIDELDDEDAFARSLYLVDLDGSQVPDEEAGFYITNDEYEDESDLPHGQYVANTPPGLGMRPARTGGVVQPAYLWTGEQPRPGETRRQAFARMMTADRQFARNYVNRVWAHLFGEGFVNPLEDWDLARLNAQTAAANNSTIQPRDPALLEYLTNLFIQSGYDQRQLFRTITRSSLYQAPYETSTDDQPLAYWRDPKRIRRLESEAIVDSLFMLLDRTQAYAVTGMSQIWNSTWHMPDSTEPSVDGILAYDERTDEERLLFSPEQFGFEEEYEMFDQQFGTFQLLDDLGRGDRFNRVQRRSESTVPNLLSLMNLEFLNRWLDEEDQITLLQAQLDALNQGQSPDTVVTDLTRNILFRDPTDQELQVLSNYLNGDGDRDVALRDVFWALINHPDFVYK